jgi:hypothetical protein
MSKKIKNPEKKDSSRRETSAEKIQKTLDLAVTLSDNFFLIIFDSLTTNFRLKRQSLTHWQTIIALDVLRGEDEIAISRKPAMKVLEIVKELSYPFFFIDFETLHSRTRFDFARVLDREAFVMTERMLDIMSDRETAQWWMNVTAPTPGPPGSGGGILTPGGGLVQ